MKLRISIYIYINRLHTIDYLYIFILYLISPYYSIQSKQSFISIFILYSLYSQYYIYLYLLGFIILSLGHMVYIRMFIDITIIIGNVIDIYLFGLVAIWISGYIYIYYLGFTIYSYLYYFRVLGMDWFLIILSMIEFSAYIFISLTLSNRISINIVAGCLLSYLLGLLCSSFILFLYILYILYLFESINLLFQSIIFVILTLFYSIFY